MLVAGTYRDSSDCEKARAKLRAEKFPPQNVEISILEGEGICDQPTVGAKGMKFAAFGGMFGALLGGILGLFTAIVGLAIPEFGAMLGVGPLLLCFTGALAIGVAGGVLGALIGLGFLEHEVRVFKTGVKKGGVLLSVTGKDQDELHNALTILRDTGAIQILWMSGDAPPSITCPEEASAEEVKQGLKERREAGE